MRHHNHDISHEHPTIKPDLFFTPIIPSICKSSTSKSNDDTTTTTTIFFISGNPGLITYYHTFLSLLGEQLKDTFESEDDDKGGKRLRRLQIYGCSLAGFELDRQSTSNSKSNPGLELSSETKDESMEELSGTGTGSARLYDLEGQIRHVQRKLEEFMISEQQQTKMKAKRKTKTKNNAILVGHSVGAYIAMEVLRRHRERENNESDHGTISTSKSTDVEFDIIGGVMLFPTVVDIAKSPSGVKLTWLLFFIPQLALVVSYLARVLTSILPDSYLRALVNRVMRSPPPEALDATVSFLKSRQGVRQALYMATDEMRTITSDKWSGDVWGVSTAREPLSRLVFYFGRNDHWVAERTREEIVALRGKHHGDGRHGPKMIVCEDGLPHAFCLRHSDIMARKVAGIVKDIIASP